MATKRESYEQRFREYPDVVTLPQFREMMGRIGDCTARKLMQGNHVRHYYMANIVSKGTKGCFRKKKWEVGILPEQCDLRHDFRAYYAK